MGYQKSKNQTKKNKPLLTIGLIVKNEEKTLARCLDSLEPLCTELNAELIITDTGSTDGTMDIARKYTNNVRFFEWCNDFSAARNDGVDQAGGEWFLSIDADEWFEDVSEIVDFFKSQEYKQYKAASYQIHSYLNTEWSSFTDCATVRMFRRSDGIRYRGAIHESFPIIEPIKVFDCFVHHTGYAPESKEQAQAKHQRNLLPLLEEVRVSPHNERSLYHLLNEYIATQNWDEVLQYKQHVMEVLKKKPTSNFRGGLYKLIVCAEVESKRLTDAVETAAEYFAANNQVYMADLDIWFMLTNAYLQLENTEKAVEAAGNYLELFNSYQEGSLKNTDLFSGVMLSVTSKYYLAVFDGIVGRLLHEQEYGRILLLFNKVDLEQLESIRNEEAFWEGLLLAAVETGRNAEFPIFVEKILQLKESKERQKSISAFFMRVAAYFDRDYYNEIIHNLLSQNTKLPSLLYEVYCQYTFGAEIRVVNQNYFVLTIFEQLLADENLEINKKRSLFGIYVEWLWSYAQQIYHPELCMNQDFDLLPGFVQFAYAARTVGNRFMERENMDYIKKLIKAAEQYPMILSFLKEHLLDIKNNGGGHEQ